MEINLEDFRLWMRKRNLAESTVTGYVTHINKLDISGSDELELSLLEDKKRLADKSYNARINALKKLGEYLRKVVPGSTLISTITELQRIKNPVSKPYPPYSDEEVKQILTTAKGWRLQAISIALYSGLRKTEIRNLNIEDLDLEKGWIYVRKGKGNKSRRVAVSETKSFENWGLRRKVTADPIKKDAIGDPWLFTSRGTRPSLSSGTVFDNLSLKLGFRFQMHRCRATFATKLFNLTLNDILVQDQMGHSSLDVTRRYIHQFDEDRAARMRELGDMY